MIEATIGISLVLNYLLREHLGVISGGFVVPAYLSIYAHNPAKIFGTFLVGFLTYLTIRLFRKVMFLIERRKLMLCLVIGFAYNFLFIKLLGIVEYHTSFQALEFSVIGNIVPGIIAYWMEEQGPVRTLSVMWINAMVTGLIVMLLFGRVFVL